MNLQRTFRHEHPDVVLRIVEGCSVETIRQVREGTLDVAFVLGGVSAPDCHSKLLWTEPLYIALSEDNRLVIREQLSWNDLADETFLIRQDGTGPQVYDHVVRRLVERGRVPQISRCAVGRDTLMHLVGSGEGITLVSEAATLVPFHGVSYRRIADETEPARFSAVWSPHNHNPALLNLLDLAFKMSRSACPV